MFEGLKAIGGVCVSVNKRINKWDFMVAGTGYDGRAAIINKYVSEEDECVLVRELGNSKDKNAIQIRTLTGKTVGYVPREYAIDMAELIDAADFFYTAYFKDVLTQGKAPIPVVIVETYNQHAEIDGINLREVVIEKRGKANQKLQKRKKKASFKDVVIGWSIVVIVSIWFFC